MATGPTRSSSGFAFLEEACIRLVEVAFHQNDDGIRYRRRDDRVALSFNPERGLLDGCVSIGDTNASLDELLRARDPSVYLPAPVPYTRGVIDRYVGLWAAAARALVGRGA